MTSTQERVRALIAERGESQRGFAQAVGIDETKLSKSLSGARRFSSTDLALIADHTQVTVDWLITGVEPQLALAARAAGGHTRTAIQEAERLAQFRSDVTFLGYPQPWLSVDLPELKGRDVDQGSEVAARALARVAEAGADPTAPDLPSLIEAVFGVDVAVTDLGAHFDGIAVSSDEVKLIIVGQTTVPTRQRFTLAHELGHLLVGDDQGLVVDQDIFNAAGDRAASERRANAFAAAFLMPADRLQAAVGPGFTPEAFARLACDLRVSPDALAIRLADLRLVNLGMRDRLRSLTSLKAAALAEQNDAFANAVERASTPRTPGLLRRDTFAAYQAGDATLRPYANLIGADVDDLYDSMDFSGSGSEVDDKP